MKRTYIVKMKSWNESTTQADRSVAKIHRRPDAVNNIDRRKAVTTTAVVNRDNNGG